MGSLDDVRQAGLDEPHRGRNARVVRDLPGDAMVGVIVGRPVDEHHVRVGFADRVDEARAGRTVVEEPLVVEIHPDQRRADQPAGGLLFLAADRGDLLPAVGRRADIAVGRDRHEDLVSRLRVQRERAGALDFDVVGMGADRENVHGCSSRMRGSIRA